MAKLILKRFHCAAGTSEIGSESPYFLTYVGDLSLGTGRLKMTRQGNWHNEVDQGEIWTVNHTVSDGFSLEPSKTVAISAMVEEDDGPDITSDEMHDNIGLFDGIEKALNKKLKGYKDSGSTIVNDTLRNGMVLTFRHSLLLALASESGAADDLMGMPKALKLQGHPGELTKLATFTGDGGVYHVRYAQA